jgi:hypothetical protein
MPDRPATKSTSRELDNAEEALDVQELVSKAIDTTEIRPVDEPVGWEEIPLPPGASR